jgi:heme exporter protein A
MEGRSLSIERGGRQLLSRLDFQLHAGEILYIAGTNGSGKTSFLRVLGGLGRYGFSGQLLFRGEEVARVRDELNYELMYIGHGAGVKATLTPIENLQWLQHLGGRPFQRTISSALADIGLAAKENTLCRQLSAGQQRRVALARVYLTPAAIWVLDEPFTALDATGVELMQGRIIEHAQAGGSVIMTSHQSLDVDYPVTRLNLNEYSQ